MTSRWRGLFAVVWAGAVAVAVGCYRGDDPSREPVPPPAVPPEDLKALVDGNNRFAIDLYKKVAEKQPGNVVLSPYSISTALAMTYAGARGETAAQMAKTLHLTIPPERLHPAEAALTQALRERGEPDRPELLTANALWGQTGVSFERGFIGLAQRYYEAGWREADFQHDPGGARDTINRWVAEQTRGKIGQLLTEKDISTHTRLVLGNAVYFKGLWAVPFAERLTVDDRFQAAGRTVPCRMMRGQRRMSYYEGDGVKLVALPYRGETKSLIVVLPEDPGGLSVLEQGLSADRVYQWVGSASLVEVQLSLPRFQAGTGGRLRRTLQELGMHQPFGPTADFTGITRRDRWQIEEVVHKATVEVDEAGTVAAAATVVSVGRPVGEKRTKVVVMRVDRPFIFILYDHPTGQAVFVGRVTDPSGDRRNSE